MAQAGNDTIILYTNHTCTCEYPAPADALDAVVHVDPLPHKAQVLSRAPAKWCVPGANRANIALCELDVPFEERIIDVDAPRPQAFLRLNPSGLVPVLIHNNRVIVESDVICQFLVDTYPGNHLCPTSNALFGASLRAHMSTFVNMYMSFQGILWNLFTAPTKADERAVMVAAMMCLVRHVEPLLPRVPGPSVDGPALPVDNGTPYREGPFVGGAEDLTLAEVLAGPFAVRAMALSRAGVYPDSLAGLCVSQAPRFERWTQRLATHPSIRAVFDVRVTVDRALAKRRRMREAAGLSLD